MREGMAGQRLLTATEKVRPRLNRKISTTYL